MVRFGRGLWGGGGEYRGGRLTKWLCMWQDKQCTCTERMVVRMGERVQNQKQGLSEGTSTHDSSGMLGWRAPNSQIESPAGWGCLLSAETKHSSLSGCSGLAFFRTTSLPFTLASCFIKIVEASRHKSAQLPSSCASSPSSFPAGSCLPLVWLLVGGFGACRLFWLKDEASFCGPHSSRLGSVLCSAKVYGFCDRFSLMKRKKNTKCLQYIL